MSENTPGQNPFAPSENAELQVEEIEMTYQSGTGNSNPAPFPEVPASDTSVPPYEYNAPSYPSYPAPGGSDYASQQPPQPPQYSANQGSQYPNQGGYTPQNPGYAPPAQGYAQMPYLAQSQPFVVSPNGTIRPVAFWSQKSKLAAGLFGIFLGAFGVHNFYLGYTGKAVAQLLITILSVGLLSWVSAIWALIEGILILASATGTTWDLDADGFPMRPMGGQPV